MNATQGFLLGGLVVVFILFVLDKLSVFPSEFFYLSQSIVVQFLGQLARFFQLLVSIAQHFFFHLEFLNRAVEVSRTLTKSHPKQYESWFSYANASGALKNYTQAVSAFKKSIELKPSEGLGKVGLAFALFGDEKPDLAIAHLKDAMKIFKANKNISWYRDCRLAIRQIKDFARFPPKFAYLWLEKNLKRVKDTFENSVLDFESLLKTP